MSLINHLLSFSYIDWIKQYVQGEMCEEKNVINKRNIVEEGDLTILYLLFALIPVFVILFIYYDLIFRQKRLGKLSSKDNQSVKEKSSSGEIISREVISREIASKEVTGKEVTGKDSSPKKEKKAKKKSKDKKSGRK